MASPDSNPNNGFVGVFSTVVPVVETVVAGGISIEALTAGRVVVTSTDNVVVCSTITTTKLGYLSSITSDIQTQLNGKEPTLTVGTSSQYYRGDKTWQTLNQVSVAGLTTSSSPTFAGMTSTGTIASANINVNNGTNYESGTLVSRYSASGRHYSYFGFGTVYQTASKFAQLGYREADDDLSLSGIFLTNYGDDELTQGIFIKKGGNVAIGSGGLTLNGALSVNTTSANTFGNATGNANVTIKGDAGSSTYLSFSTATNERMRIGLQGGDNLIFQRINGSGVFQFENQITLNGSLSMGTNPITSVGAITSSGSSLFNISGKAELVLRGTGDGTTFAHYFLENTAGANYWAMRYQVSGDYWLAHWNGFSVVDAFKLTATGNATFAGNLTVNGTGTNTFAGSVEVASHLIPKYTDTSDLGSSTKMFRHGWLSELDAVLFAKNTITLLGGWFYVTKNAGVLGVDVNNSQTTIDFGTSMTVGDFVIFRSSLQVEYMTVGSLVSGTTYNVTRNVDGSGINTWIAGSPFAVLGQSGDGRIEMKAGSSPYISVFKQGSAYNLQSEVTRMCDTGFYGYDGIDTSDAHTTFAIKNDGTAKIAGFAFNPTSLSTSGKTALATGAGIYIGALGIALGTTFSVDSSGNMNATAGTFSGAINGASFATNNTGVGWTSNLVIDSETLSSALHARLRFTDGTTDFLKISMNPLISNGYLVALSGQWTALTYTGNPYYAALNFTATGSGIGAGALTYGLGLFTVDGSSSNSVIVKNLIANTTRTNTGTGVNYGLYANCSGGTTNWAGYFDSGNVKIVNTLYIGANSITATQLGNLVAAASSDLSTQLTAKANVVSPTFTGTVGGITASMVGLGNVTNESKATMHTDPTFTGTMTINPAANGQSLQIKTLSESLSGMGGGSSTATTTMQIPANCLVLAVSVKVTASGGNSLNVNTVAGNTTATQFNTAAISIISIGSDVGTKAGMYYNSTAQTIKLTLSGGVGASPTFRVTIHYIEITPATS